MRESAIEIPPLITEASLTSHDSFRKTKNRLALFIAVFAFSLYAQSISFDYAYDDIPIIKKNNLVTQGFSAIPTLFTTDKWKGFNSAARVPEYRPVPMAVFAMEWGLFPDNPLVYHLVNVLLYSLTCFLLFLLLCKLLQNRNLVFPFVCTLLFAAHPIHTEVVDNIKSLDEILCLLFSVLSVSLFVTAEERKNLFRFILACICFFIAILSKETGVPYLLITPLILFVFTKTETKRILIIFAALTCLTGIFLLIRYQVLHPLSQQRLETLYTPYANTLVTAPDFISQKATALYILLRYIILLIFPYHLSYDYSIAQIPIQQPLNPAVFIGILCYLTMGIYAVIRIHRKNIIAFAIFFYLLTLGPVSNLLILIYSTMAERFLFMPSLGFCMALTFILIKITKTEIHNGHFKITGRLIKANPSLFVIVFIIVGLYSIRTIARNSDWKNNLALYGHDSKVSSNSARVHFQYGSELLFTLYPETKNKAKQNAILEQAIKELTTSISIFGRMPHAYQNLAKAYYYKGEYSEAILNYEIAIQMKTIPDPESFNNLGLLYSTTGALEKALSMLDSAMKYKPQYTDALINKTDVYLKQGKNQNAIAECDIILSFDPKNKKAFLVKGIAYLNLKLYDQSIDNARKALAVDSSDVTSYKVLWMAYQGMGDQRSADLYFQKSNQIEVKQ